MILIFLGNKINAQNGSEYLKLETKTEESQEAFQKQSVKYIDLRLSKINKLYKQQDRQIKKALKRLSKKEKRLRAKYKKQDSLLKVKLRRSVGYDSLQSVYANKKANAGKVKLRRSVHKGLDSLSTIQSYANKKLRLAKDKGLINSTNSLPNTSSQIDGLKSKLAVQQEMQGLISQYSNQFKNAFGSIGNKADLKGLNKELFYYKQKIKAFKNIANEPERLEELALEYLKGTKGFESALSNGVRKQSSQGAVSMQGMKPEDLERMGFQTKRSVRKQLNKKFNLKQPEKLKAFKNKIAKAKQEFNKLKTQKSQLKKQLEEGKKEGFKPNPMRGLPFSKRIEKNFNWQVKGVANGEPAKVDFGGQIGFKHTQRLTYNLLAGTSVGLGENIRNIKITYQGFRTGVNLDWKWIWGVSGQIGYEILFKKYTNSFYEQTETNIEPQLVNHTKKLKHTAYAGLMKTYKINKKYNGTILLAYDFLWNKYYKPSPFVIRFGWR